MHAHCLIHARIQMRFHMARQEAKERLHNAFFKCADFESNHIASRLSSAQPAENDIGNICRNCHNKCVSDVFT
jgi:hypothetical protein